MDFLLNRYRNLTVLLIVIVAQLLLLAYQVKTNKDVPLMRVWAVSAVTPVEQGLEFVRRHTFGVAGDYFDLVHVREQNDRLQRDLDRLKLENHYLRSELSTAERVKQLDAFRQDTPSKTIVARAIGNGTGANSKTIFVDRGTTAQVQNGMAVITPDGIVGKVVAAYPTASLVMLMTDPTFAAGVVSQKNHVHGTLKGLGGPKCRVDYVQNEEKVDAGEWFYTSGDDGIFPRGFPAGQVASVQNGRSSKEIIVTPSGFQSGLDEVLIVTEGIHQSIPDRPIASAPIKVLAPPADGSNSGGSQSTAALATDADKLRQEYKQVGEQEKIQFGASGTKPPDFSKLGKSAEPASNPAPPNGQATSTVVSPNPSPANGLRTAPPPATATAVKQPMPLNPGSVAAQKPPSTGAAVPATAQAVHPPSKPANAGAPATATALKPPSLTPTTGQPVRAPSMPANYGGVATGTALKPTSTSTTGQPVRPLSTPANSGAPATATALRPPGQPVRSASMPATGSIPSQKPPAQKAPGNPGGAIATGAVLKTASASPGVTTVRQPSTGLATTPGTATARVPNKPVERSSAAPAPESKPKSRAPVLETDPTDADLANEAVAERIQRERSNSKVVSEDKNTQILAPAAPPKSKPAVPKTTPAKTPSAGAAGIRTGAATQ